MGYVMMFKSILASKEIKLVFESGLKAREEQTPEFRSKYREQSQEEKDRLLLEGNKLFLRKNAVSLMQHGLTTYLKSEVTHLHTYPDLSR